MTNGEKFEALEQRVGQMETSHRIMQMLLQQIGNSISPMASDVQELANRQRDIQYRLLAIQTMDGKTIDQINKVSEQLQLKDFNEASMKENQEKGYVPSQEPVGEDSVVIITTTTPDEVVSKGFLRSKILVSEIGLPDLKDKMMGKQVGDKFESDVNGVKHVMEVLEILKAPKKEEPANG
jgi:hypothetical protein